MSIDLKQFYQVFFEESFEGLDVMEQSLLQIQSDNGQDPELINTIFRAAHSIKGGSGTFGFMDMAEFTHLLETLLDEAREGKRTLDAAAVDLLLRSTDCLRAMVTGHQNEQPAEAGIADELAAAFKVMLDGKAASDSAQPLVANSEQVLSPRSGDLVWCIGFKPNRDILLSGNEPSRIFRELSSLGDVIPICNSSQLPAFNLLSPDECYLSWQLWLDSDCSADDIREIFEWVIDDCDLQIDSVDRSHLPSVAKSENIATDQSKAQLPNQISKSESTDRAPVKEPQKLDSAVEEGHLVSKDDDLSSTKGTPIEQTSMPKAVEAPQPAAQASSIRVGIDKVDNLINLVGELVITQSMLSELGTDFSMERLERLNSGLEQLMLNTRELQESVMRIRMLPISFAFNRFPRMIRDLSVKIGKKVELKLSGEQTELDKTVMEQISDPLVHLVRNAIDHGLEPPEERLKSGKGETGNVHLNAYHKSGNIVIEISDDGRGIDTDRVLAKAKEKGLVPESAELTQQQIFDLIFEPGFSTAACVSDISGRGVGMDVVKRNIKSLGGRIEVSSVKQKGSTFKVHLPLTLAILDGQLVRVGQETYVIPLVTIVESLQMQPDLINHISGNIPMYRLREDNVPLVELVELFDVQKASGGIDNRLLVVVEAEGEKLGLKVDDLLAQQQVVIKSLESNYKRIEGVSGATILGDGSVALILDVSGVMNLALNQKPRKNKAA